MYFIKIPTTSFFRSKSMLWSMYLWTLYIVFNASKTMKFGAALKNRPIYMCNVHCSQALLSPAWNKLRSTLPGKGLRQGGKQTQFLGQTASPFSDENRQFPNFNP